MAILILADPESVAMRAGKILTAVYRQSVRERGFFSLALSGGKTPLPLFRYLADPATHYGNIDWTHTKIFWADERCVPQDHKASNFGLAQKHLFAHLPQKPILFPMYDQKNFCTSESQNQGLAKNIPTAEEWAKIFQKESQIAESYAAMLKTQTNSQTIPKLDCILLGMGSDGHTASLFPNDPVLKEQHKLVACVQAPRGNRKAGDFDRLTLTLPVLNAARLCLILVCGAEKAQTLHTVLHPRADDPLLPVQMVRPTSGRLIWIIDKASASSLS